MNILLINGSPHSGNTAHVVGELQYRLVASGANAQVVNLREYAIKPCTGCYQCFLKGEDRCPLKDDVAGLWHQMESADGVVFAAPVYCLGVPALMKNLMERIASHAHRPSFYDKPALILSTTAGMGNEQVIAQLKWFEIMGFRVIGSQGFTTYPYGRDRPKVAAAKDKALDRLAERLVHHLSFPRPQKARLIRVVQFHGLKLNADADPAVYSADYAYYQDKEFYGGLRLGWFHKLFGRFILRVGGAAIKATLDFE